MRYVSAVLQQLDQKGSIVEGGFKRYVIVDRAQKNRVVFSSISFENNLSKLLSMMGLKEDNFDRAEFEKRMAEKRAQKLSETVTGQ